MELENDEKLATGSPLNFIDFVDVEKAMGAKRKIIGNVFMLAHEIY